MVVHKENMKRAAKEMKRDREYREKHLEEENERIRSSYLWSAKLAREIHDFQINIPKPTLRARACYWLGQLIPRTHWGIYSAGGRRRLVIWKTWLGKVKKEIDIKIG